MLETLNPKPQRKVWQNFRWTEGTVSREKQTKGRKGAGGLVDSNKNVFRMAAAAKALWMNMPESRR